MSVWKWISWSVRLLFKKEYLACIPIPVAIASLTHILLANYSLISWIIAYCCLGGFILFTVHYLFTRARSQLERCIVPVAYPDWVRAPAECTIPGLLSGARPEASLQIVARTAFRWLCGTERSYRKAKVEHDDSDYQSERDDLHEMITRAIMEHRHFMIQFILQCPMVEMCWWNGQEDKKKENMEHFNEAVGSYLELKKGLTKRQGMLSMVITAEPVPNSMTRMRIKEPITGKPAHVSTCLLIVDLGDPYFLTGETNAAERQQHDHMTRPFVVFQTVRGDIRDYEYRFAACLDKASRERCKACAEMTCAAKELLADSSH